MAIDAMTTGFPGPMSLGATPVNIQRVAPEPIPFEGVCGPWHLRWLISGNQSPAASGPGE